MLKLNRVTAASTFSLSEAQGTQQIVETVLSFALKNGIKIYLCEDLTCKEEYQRPGGRDMCIAQRCLHSLVCSSSEEKFEKGKISKLKQQEQTKTRLRISLSSPKKSRF